jgi:hypothetical protein
MVLYDGNHSEATGAPSMTLETRWEETAETAETAEVLYVFLC